MTSHPEPQLHPQVPAATAELVRSRDRYISFLDMVKALHRAADIQEALGLAAPAAARILDMDVIISIESGSQGLLSACYPEPEQSDPGAMSAATHLSPAEIASGTRGDDQQLTWMRIRQSEVPVGILFAIGARGRVFGSPERKLLLAITELLGAALESIAQGKARLGHARTQSEPLMAHTGQSHLLPSVTGNVPGLSVSVASLTARAVGTDFHTYTNGPDGQWLVCVGDVAGNGVPSTLSMTMLATTIRNADRFSDISGPASLLGFVNDALYEEMDHIGLFATIFAACHHPARSELRYANAGHAPVIFAPADGPARLVEADHIPIGMTPCLLPVERVLPFVERDILLIGTDGLTNVRSASGELFGPERLMTIIEAERDGNSAAIRDAILTALDNFRLDEPQADDLTLVILKGHGA